MNAEEREQYFLQLIDRRQRMMHYGNNNTERCLHTWQRPIENPRTGERYLGTDKYARPERRMGRQPMMPVIFGTGMDYGDRGGGGSKPRNAVCGSYKAGGRRP